MKTSLAVFCSVNLDGVSTVTWFCYGEHVLIVSQQDVLMKVVGKEGFFSLWKGFTPYYARLGPHTVLTFIFLEQMNAAYYKYVLKDETRKSTL